MNRLETRKRLRNYCALVWVMVLSSCISPTTQYLEGTEEEVHKETQEQEALLRQHQLQLPAAVESTEEIRIQNYYRLKRVGAKIQNAALSLCRNASFQENPCRFEFVVLKREGINAFADGQKIYVSLDMLQFANTDDELALVLGHEYAHNIMKHVSAQKTNTIFGSLLGTALDITVGSVMGVGTGSVFSKVGSKAGHLAYSQSFEKEADYIGLYITALADYSIAHSGTFWRRMSLEHPKAIYIATTHPTNPERYIGLQKAAEEIEQKRIQGQPLIPNLRPVE